MPTRSRAVLRGASATGRALARVMRLGRQYRSVEDSRMTLTEHLQELRARLLKSLLAVALLTIVVGVWLYHPVFQTLLHPYCGLPPDRRLLGHSCALTFTGVTDAFTIRLKVAIIGGVLLSMPIWLYQLWAFITPGLHQHERRYSLAFVFTSVGLFAGGVTLAYYILPTALDVLLSFGGPDLKALLTVDQYLGFIAHMLTIFGVSFEFPLVLIMLNLAGVLSAQRLRQWRRLAIFLLTVFAGAATPSTDPFTMLAMAVPLCLLYEAAVIFARIHDRRKEKRALSSAYAGLEDDQTSPLTMNDLDEPPEVGVGGHGRGGFDAGSDSDIT